VTVACRLLSIAAMSAATEARRRMARCVMAEKRDPKGTRVPASTAPDLTHERTLDPTLDTTMEPIAAFTVEVRESEVTWLWDGSSWRELPPAANRGRA
jgi:hypothetical protein